MVVREQKEWSYANFQRPKAGSRKSPRGASLRP
jgi:hypothetical protein